MKSPIQPEPHAPLKELPIDAEGARAPGRVFRTPSESLEMTARPDGVSLRRITGPKVHDLTLSWDDLALLAGAFARWRRVRDAWPTYVISETLEPAHGAIVERVPPWQTEKGTVMILGARDARLEIRLDLARELRPLKSPRPLAPGIDAIADLWRHEPAPHLGPLGGELVGERWLLDGRLIVDLRRHEARSYHGEDRFCWLGLETNAPAELAALRPTIEREARR